MELKGFPRPVRAWRAVHESRVESRFEALALRAAPPPLVGREEELELLLAALAPGPGGRGPGGAARRRGRHRQVAPGRRAAARRCRRGDAHERLHWFCAPQHRDSALRPVITQLERAAAFAPGDAPEAKLRQAPGPARTGDTTQEELALLAELLGLRGGRRRSRRRAEPARQRRKRTLAALVRQVEALAARRPVLVVFEDAHWADPTTLELLDLLVGRAAGLPLLLVVTLRPEFQPPWVGQAHVAELRLRPPGPRDSAALVGRVAAAAGAARCRRELVERIVERTDGVPLFVEELTRAVLESRL